MQKRRNRENWPPTSLATKLLAVTLELSHAFIAGLPEAGQSRFKADPALEKLLAQGCAEARVACPLAAITDAQFLTYAGQRVGVWPSLTAPLAELRLPDLFIACGCALKDHAALASFERTHIAKVGLFVRKLRLSGAMRDDLVQLLREKLLVGSAKAPAKIFSYSGKGSLEGWLRISAVHAAMNLLRTEKRYAQEGEPEAIFDTPEVLHYRAENEKVITDSVRAALAVMSERERSLLKLYFLEELSLDRISEVYQVHLSTVGRWIEKAREALLEGTQAELRKRLRVSDEDIEDLWAAASAELASRIAELLR